MVEVGLLFFLLLFTASVLGVQIAGESSLALKVKQHLFLLQPYNKKLDLLCKLSVWKRIIGTAYYVLLPFFIILALSFRFHRFLSELLDCRYCTSTWIFGFLLYFFTENNLIYCIIFAPLAIIGVYIIEKLQR